MKKEIVLYPKLAGLAMFILIFTITGLFAYFIYLKGIEAVENEIKAGLLSSVEAAATIIDGDLHKIFNSQTSRNDQLYLNTIAPLEKIRQASKNIRYIYTNILKDNAVYFVLNPSPQNDNDGDGLPDTAPALMDPYVDASPALLSALKSGIARVSEDSYSDEWGTFYSAYAPFYDKDNNLVGTLGMDLDLEGFDKKLENIREALKRTGIVIVIVSIFSGTGIWYVLKFALHLNIQKIKLKTKYIFNKKELNRSREIRKIIVSDIKKDLDLIVTDLEKKLSKNDYDYFKESSYSLSYKLWSMILFFDLKLGTLKTPERTNLIILDVFNDLKTDLFNCYSLVMDFFIAEMPNMIYENQNQLHTLFKLCAQFITGLVSRKQVFVNVIMVEEFIDTFVIEVKFTDARLYFPFDNIQCFSSPYFSDIVLYSNSKNMNNYIIPLIFEYLKPFNGNIRICKSEKQALIISLTLVKSEVI